MIAQVYPDPCAIESAAKSRKVLLVDDDETHLEILRHGLEQNRFEVIGATRGCELLDYIVEEKPDVIVMDVHLPDANGLELCREIVDTPITSHIPVIILSGTSEEAIVRKARLCGCRFFLSKPFDPNAILIVIRESLGEDW